MFALHFSVHAAAAIVYRLAAASCFCHTLNGAFHCSSELSEFKAVSLKGQYWATTSSAFVVFVISQANYHVSCPYQPALANNANINKSHVHFLS